VSLIERGKKSIPLRRLETAARLLGVASEVITGAPAFYDRLVPSDPFTVVSEPAKWPPVWNRARHPKKPPRRVLE